MKRIIIPVFIALVVGTICFYAGMNFNNSKAEKLNKTDLVAASKIIGIEFSEAEIDSAFNEVSSFKESYEYIREMKIPNHVWPAQLFNPIPIGAKFETKQEHIKFTSYKKAKLPGNINDLAFYPIGKLAALIKSKQISSTELTKFFLERLKKYDPQLHCVVTLTEDLALKQAQRADKEIRAGKYRGLLHGIPYGAKDLLNTKKYKTTYGAMTYKDQLIDEDAVVVKKLEEAGAVLVAKLTLGALAMGDVWYDEKTRNPWNLEQGSSGSSAGPASAVSAGLVPFAIGSETWGSIVSPSTRCGVTGLRPTYGRVSRTGAMALSWSMDKLGPICNYAEDCAIVLDAIRGPDGKDHTLYNYAFNYKNKKNLKGMKIGYLKSSFDRDSARMEYNNHCLSILKELGAELIPFELPEMNVYNLSFILSAEAATAFDELTLSDKDDLLVQQHQNAWPNIFRTSRFITAVEFIQASRARQMLIQEMDKRMKDIDLYVTPSFGKNLLLTNLTGHPCVVIPNGFPEKNSPISISFVGKLFGEADIIAVAKAYQDLNNFHARIPLGIK